MSAEILKLSDYRIEDTVDSEIGIDIDIDSEIDLATAVDVAIRDLREILLYWGSDVARQRAEECHLTLRRAYSGCVGQTKPR